MSKKETEWLRFGNYMLGEESDGDDRRMVARSVSGNWRLSWGEDTYMFAVLKSMMSDEHCHSYVDAFLTLCYMATSYPHDMTSIIERQTTPLMDGFARLFNEQTAYELSLKAEASAEEDDQALSEVVEMEDVADEIARLDEEDEP